MAYAAVKNVKRHGFSAAVEKNGSHDDTEMHGISIVGGKNDMNHFMHGSLP